MKKKIYEVVKNHKKGWQFEDVLQTESLEEAIASFESEYTYDENWEILLEENTCVWKDEDWEDFKDEPLDNKLAWANVVSGFTLRRK